MCSLRLTGTRCGGKERKCSETAGERPPSSHREACLAQGFVLAFLKPGARACAGSLWRGDWVAGVDAAEWLRTACLPLWALRRRAQLGIYREVVLKSRVTWPGTCLPGLGRALGGTWSQRATDTLIEPRLQRREERRAARRAEQACGWTKCPCCGAGGWGGQGARWVFGCLCLGRLYHRCCLLWVPLLLIVEIYLCRMCSAFIEVLSQTCKLSGLSWKDWAEWNHPIWQTPEWGSQILSN